MKTNQEPDLFNHLNHEAFELKCHDQQCQRQQEDQAGPILKFSVSLANFIQVL